MSEQLFVACRTFKTQGKLITAGDVFTLEELQKLKYFKILMGERRFRAVPEDEEGLQSLQDYFTVRWGADFAKNLAERVSKGSSSAETSDPGASANPTPPGASTATTPQGAQVPQTTQTQGGIVSGRVAPVGDKGPEKIVPLAQGTQIPRSTGAPTKSVRPLTGAPSNK